MRRHWLSSCRLGLYTCNRTWMLSKHHPWYNFDHDPAGTSVFRLPRSPPPKCGMIAASPKALDSNLPPSPPPMIISFRNSRVSSFFYLSSMVPIVSSIFTSVTLALDQAIGGDLDPLLSLVMIHGAAPADNGTSFPTFSFSIKSRRPFVYLAEERGAVSQLSTRK